MAAYGHKAAAPSLANVGSALLATASELTDDSGRDQVPLGAHRRMVSPIARDMDGDRLEMFRIDQSAGGADFEIESRWRHGVKRNHAIGLGVLAERQGNRHFQPLRPLPGGADIAHFVGFDHEMVHAPLGRDLEQRQRMMTRIAMQENAADLDRADAAMEFLAQAHAQYIAIEGSGVLH